MSMIAVIDYGIGNVRSVAGALEKLGITASITADPLELRAANKLILPGVGAFGDGMQYLSDCKLIDILNELVLEKKTPILGICLGAQLMAEKGYEFGEWDGLGWIKGSVKKLEITDPSLKLPHVGWNNAKKTCSSILFDNIPDDALFYYTHSFHIQCSNDSDIAASCEYGSRFVAALSHQNIHATQFHPEKSQKYGLTLLKNFVEKA